MIPLAVLEWMREQERLREERRLDEAAELAGILAGDERATAAFANRLLDIERRFERWARAA